jgi:hypothetical protein
MSRTTSRLIGAFKPCMFQFRICTSVVAIKETSSTSTSLPNDTAGLFHPQLPGSGEEIAWIQASGITRTSGTSEAHTLDTLFRASDRTTEPGSLRLHSRLGRRLALLALEVDRLEKVLDRLHGFTWKGRIKELRQSRSVLLCCPGAPSSFLDKTSWANSSNDSHYSLFSLPAIITTYKAF